MKSLAPSLAVVLLSTLAGCATSGTSPQPRAGQVKHMIVCQMRTDADMTPLINANNRLMKLRDVLDVTAVTNRQSPTTRPSEHAAPEVTLILTLADDAALQRTKGDPAYQSVLNDVLRPNAISVTTSDSVLQNYQVSDRYTEETTAATLHRRAAAMKQQEESRSRTK